MKDERKEKGRKADVRGCNKEKRAG